MTHEQHEEEFLSCDICGGPVGPPGTVSPVRKRCQSCEDQRTALGEAFMDETGSTRLYDKGDFVLRIVRKNLGMSHG